MYNISHSQLLTRFPCVGDAMEQTQREGQEHPGPDQIYKFPTQARARESNLGPLAHKSDVLPLS